MDEVFVSEILVFKKCLWYNDGMKKNKHGFTLIEVAIFLAVTGALFAAITIGVQNSIYQQRYNDVVDNFVDFLGNLYSEVVNVQNDGTGRTDQAIYGKLVTFGEDDDGAETGKQTIRVYNVIAKAVNSWDVGNQNTLELLRRDDMGTNVIHKITQVNEEGDEPELIDQYEPVGMVEEYTPRWASKIENPDNFEDFEGSLLIVRNAQTGMVRTFFSKNVIQVNKTITEGLGDNRNPFEYGDGLNYLDEFDMVNVDFCVNPNGNEATNTRMDVRVIRGAQDASGVEKIPFDNEHYECRVTEGD